VLCVVLALAAAAGFGVSDYLAGLAARRASVITANMGANVAGLLAVLAVLPFARPGTATPAGVGWGAAAGVATGVCQLLLVAGFRDGEFSVAAPLEATVGSGLAVVAGVMLLGERPGGLAWAGLALAFPAVAVVSAPSGRRRGLLPGAGFGLGAGVGAGSCFIALDAAPGGGGIWVILSLQAAAVIVVWVLAVATGEQGWPAGAMVLSAGSGVLAAGAGVATFAAFHAGLMAVASVLTAQYPAVTIILALALQKERPGLFRGCGLVVAGVAVALIAVGSAALLRWRYPQGPAGDAGGRRRRRAARAGARRRRSLRRPGTGRSPPSRGSPSVTGTSCPHGRGRPVRVAPAPGRQPTKCVAGLTPTKWVRSLTPTK
jgi:drug/metabolite transporter (DMT)-like permease